MALPSETVSFPGSGLVFVNTYSDTVSAAYRGAVIAAENQLQIHFTDSFTVNVSFDLANTTWVYTNLYDPIFQIVGWCQGGNSRCTFTWTPTVAGTLTIDSYGVPRCDRLNSSHTTATVIVK